MASGYDCPMRLKKFTKKTGRKAQLMLRNQIRFDKTKVECLHCHNHRVLFRRRWQYQKEIKKAEGKIRNTRYQAKDIEEPWKQERIYMPPKSDFGIDESKFTYGPKQSKTSESDAKTSDFASCKSNSSVETLESVPKTAINEPKAVSKPKVWSNALIIEEYESDSDDEYVIKPLKEQERPSFAFVNTVKHVKTPRETFKKQNTCSLSPKADKRECNGLMSKKLGLGYRFTRKACFVCGSFGHLIRDYDFHEKRMAKQVKLNKQKGKGTSQGFLVNTARQNFYSQAAATSTARKVNTARPIMNDIRPRINFYKSHSPIKRPFNRTTTPKANFTNHKVNNAGDKTVSAIWGNRETAVKASDDPQKALKNN
ncbi:hypothetical protein Tco_0320700 [Tanacetum coccineum]